MPSWITGQSSHGMSRAILLIALVLIYFTVSCTFQSGSRPNPSPSASQQFTFIPPQELDPSTSEKAIATSKPDQETPRAPIIPTINTPTPTSTKLPIAVPESTPFVPIRGNADKIAFIEQNEIWTANLDGSALTQLTNDGLVKTSLHWSPNLEELFYISELCVNTINAERLKIETLACFKDSQHLESFQISPDGTQVAISLDGELYVIPFNEGELDQARSGADLSGSGSCPSLAPYKHRGSMEVVNRAYWSKDGQRIAILRKGSEAGEVVDLIHILDVSRCADPVPRLDEFPATRFEMENYTRNPVLQDFAWDGGDLFALTDFKRSDGYGDLWIYNTHLHRGFKANPVGGKCCYRDPVFSPDGKYLAFAFQDANLASNGATVLYYIPYAALDSSLVYPPLPLPEDFFTEPRAKPQPALHPAP